MLNKRKRILILGGTGEARSLATYAVETLPNNVEIISSYAGRTVRMKEPPGTIREGGFGGTEGLKNFIRSGSIDLLIDATHPFATSISKHAAMASEATKCPRLILQRPGWALPLEARVINVNSMTDAAHWLKGCTQRVFLSTGSQELQAFSDLKNTWFLVRLITKPEIPLPLTKYKLVTDRPPFQKQAELTLLQENNIEYLVSKDSGGPVPAKIWAATALDIPIILIRQPDLPTGSKTNDISEALAWIQERL